MAITVGELLVAIQADDTPLRRAMAEVDRLAQGYADRSASYQNAVNAARKENTAAQKALNAEQSKYNRLLEKAKNLKREGKKLSSADFEKLRETTDRLEKARARAAETSAVLGGAIAARDANRLEMARARERLKAARAVHRAESDAADDRAKENRLTQNEYVGRRKSEKAANRDINAQRKSALKEEASVEKRIADERERYRKLDVNQRRSSIIQQLQEREALERDMQRRVADGEKNAQRDLQKLRKRNAIDYTKWWETTLNQQLGPLRGAPQMGQALPPGMRLRNGQLVPMPAGRQPVQGPALPPNLQQTRVPRSMWGPALPLGMRLSNGRLVPIARPSPAPRRRGFGGGGDGIGLDTFGITSTLIGTAGLAGLIRTANEMQVIQQRLNQVSASGQEASIAFNKIAESAQRLRQPVAETVELYTKLRQSNDMVGLSANETVKVTQAFSAALRVSGATGQTAASSLLQFGQAMAKGRLDGDEFRTVAENASEVLRVLERYLNETGEGARLFGAKTKITRGELLKFREEGKLTSDLMAKALLWDLDNLTKKASELPPSLAQGMTALQNATLMAMTNTRDVRRAVESLATKMVEVADVVSESGPFITGFAKAALAVGAVTLAVRGLSAVMLGLSRNPGLIALQALAATVAILDERQRRKNAVDFSLVDDAETAAQANKAALTYAKQINQISEQIRKKEKERTESLALQKERMMGPLTSTSTIDRDIEALVSKRKELTRAMKEAAQREEAFAAMDRKPEVVKPEPSADSKKGRAKKETDEITAYLQKLADLRDANKLRSEDARAAIDMVAEEERVFADKSTTLDRYILSLKRLELAQRIGFMTSLDVETQAKSATENMDERIDKAVELAEGYELLGKEAKKAALEEIKAMLLVLRARMHTESDPNKRLELAKKFQAIQKSLYENNAFGIGTGGVIEDAEGKAKQLTMLERHVRNLNRALMDLMLSAPGELFTTYFDAMVESVETGVSRVGQRMREKIGGIFKDIGKNLIEQGMSKLADWFSKKTKAMFGKMIQSMAASTTVLGKFLTKIMAALKNPLIAGPALIAIGVAMAAYGAKMGAAGRGESGGDLAGGIGGLGVGGREQTLRYSFADRRNPLEGNRVVGAPQQSIVVQQTIIGPNDPVAQRQIGELVNNAARRGLVRNG